MTWPTRSRRGNGDFYLCDNGIGVVDVHVSHVERVAQLLAERHPGLIFLWDNGTSTHPVTISAVRADKRKIAVKVESAIVAAGELIARNVAAKYPEKSGGLFRWLGMGAKVRRGWHYNKG